MSIPLGEWTLSSLIREKIPSLPGRIQPPTGTLSFCQETVLPFLGNFWLGECFLLVRGAEKLSLEADLQEITAQTKKGDGKTVKKKRRRHIITVCVR